MTQQQFRRGEIWTVDLEPVVGSELGKARPALIIQNDIGNLYSPVLIVAALTSGEEASYDVQVEVKAPEGGLHHRSLVLLNQIRAIDKRHVGRYWGRLSAQTMQRWTKPSKSAWVCCQSSGSVPVRNLPLTASLHSTG